MGLSWAGLDVYDEDVDHDHVDDGDDDDDDHDHVDNGDGDIDDGEGAGGQCGPTEG